MVEPILSDEELQALRDAAGASRSSKQRSTSRIPQPIALIAEQRAGEAARPASLRIATRWASVARSRIATAFGAKLEIQVAASDAVHPPMLKEALATSWTSLVEVPGRPGVVAIAVSGPMIEWIAAQLLGARELSAPRGDRPPSRTALRVFTRAGEILFAALREAWREEQNIEISAVSDEDRAGGFRFAVADFESTIAVTLDVSGPTTGTIRMIAKPETLVAPPPAAKVAPISRARFESALADVPVEVRVELGRARLKMSELKSLRPGSMISLAQPTDALLPVSCGGIVKAFGKPAVSRGALAIEIVTKNSQGSK